MCDELERKMGRTERRGESRGRIERARSRVDEGFIYEDLYYRFVARTGTKGAGGAPNWQYLATTLFSAGSWHEPVLKVRHEPVLMRAARLAVETGTNDHISAGSNTNLD